jgi:hypothetical protein
VTRLEDTEPCEDRPARRAVPDAIADELDAWLRAEATVHEFAKKLEEADKALSLMKEHHAMAQRQVASARENARFAFANFIKTLEEHKS